MNQIAPNYMFESADKPDMKLIEVPLVKATADSVQGYGCLVDDPDNFEIEITRWPAQGWRPVDPGTGDEGGVVEGEFICEWRGDVLYGENDAVKGNYVLGWSTNPQRAQTTHQSVPRDQMIIWHMNYHPDGGQLFYPLDAQPFVVPVALPGDDLTPDKIIALWCDGTQGLYIHANIWHEGVFSVGDTQRFRDRQGRVHARVSCDFAAEFGAYISFPLRSSF